MVGVACELARAALMSTNQPYGCVLENENHVDRSHLHDQENISFYYIFNFGYSDYFTQLRVSAHIPSHLIRECTATCWKMKTFAENIQTFRIK